MSDPQPIADIIADELAKPASTTIEGNAVTRRSVGELLEAERASEAKAAASSPSGGVRRSRFRHRGPAGGPT